MSEPFVVKSDDPILSALNFKPYRNMSMRKAKQFMPKENEPQTLDINVPWGGKLTATRGDYLVSEINAPNDYWPVAQNIFDETYLMIGQELCVKRAITWLVPMVDLVNGDEDRLIDVVTLEGTTTVRAGDFYLAQGVQGEIWAYPKQ